MPLGMMLLPGVSVHLVSGAELRAADGAIDALNRLALGQVRIFWRGMVAALMLVKRLV
jgi:hypothetical protein